MADQANEKKYAKYGYGVMLYFTRVSTHPTVDGSQDSIPFINKMEAMKWVRDIRRARDAGRLNYYVSVDEVVSLRTMEVA